MRKSNRQEILKYKALCYSIRYNCLGSNKQPVLYTYDRITFSSFHILQLCELASQAAGNRPTGVFVTD